MPKDLALILGVLIIGGFLIGLVALTVYDFGWEEALKAWAVITAMSAAITAGVVLLAWGLTS